MLNPAMLPALAAARAAELERVRPSREPSGLESPNPPRARTGRVTIGRPRRRPLIVVTWELPLQQGR